MKLFIDGDAFPNLLKQIVLRAIEKQKINIGSSNYIKYIIVDTKQDAADNKIVEMLNRTDLVITADIPLADRTIEKNAHAIDHRGAIYTKDNIKEYLAIRNLMQEIRNSGEITKGPAPFSQKDAQQFANSFNAFLQKHNKK